MPNFKYAPHCAFATLVALEPDVMVGNRIATWTGEGPDGEIDISSTDLRERGHAIEVRDNGAGLYAIRDQEGEALKFDVNYAEGIVQFEEREAMPLDAFLSSAVRVTKDGHYICSFAEPLYRQQTACREAGGDMGHQHDIQALAEKARANGFSTNVGMYDIVAADITDEVPYLQALQNMMAGRRLTESSTLFRRMDAAGLPMQAWHEIKDLPQYGIEQVRAVFRMFMSRYVDTFPIERILRIEAPTEAGLRAHLDRDAEFLSEDEPFQGGNIIRGYQTSTVRHYRSDGAEVILFSDPMGEYAYSWPSAAPATEPTPAP